MQVKPRPTAIFACNDIMAIGALRAAHQYGLSVHYDISIVGFEIENYLIVRRLTMRSPGKLGTSENSYWF